MYSDTGLYSDTELQKEDDENFTLNPEEWSSFNDILAKKHEDLVATPTLTSPAPVATDGSSSDTTIEEEKSTIFIGDKEKLIATSKLSSLISLLEKDREYKSGPTGPKSGPKKTKELEIEKTEAKLGTSPANFSFLEENFERAEKTLERAHSTSFINDIKKINSKLTEESQYSASVGTALKSEPQPLLTEEEDTKSKYRRCSSLKSGKTPPGTPGRRKIVR